ncbi:hypothetical protein [Hymenobacter ruber]
MKSYYCYRGDKHTDEALKGKPCRAVKNVAGKCIRGKNANMLVEFAGGIRHVVLARQLRKIWEWAPDGTEEAFGFAPILT